MLTSFVLLDDARHFVTCQPSTREEHRRHRHNRLLMHPHDTSRRLAGPVVDPRHPPGVVERADQEVLGEQIIHRHPDGLIARRDQFVGTPPAANHGEVIGEAGVRSQHFADRAEDGLEAGRVRPERLDPRRSGINL